MHSSPRSPGWEALITGVTVSLEPPLPVYLFNVVAGLKDKSAKGYPVKKVSQFPEDDVPMTRTSSLSMFSAASCPMEINTYLLWWDPRACARQKSHQGTRGPGTGA